MEKIKHEKRISKAVCITLAIILWLYVSFYENPTMTKTVNDVPVTVSDEQIKSLRDKNWSVLSISENTVDVEVTSQRLNLSKFTKENLTAVLNLDIRSITKAGKYTVPIRIVYDHNISASYYVEVENIDIIIEPIKTDTFAVEAEIDNKYIAYNSYELETKDVTVSAPESIFNQIAEVKTEVITLDKETNNVSKSLVLYDKEGNIISGDHITITPKKVDVTFSYFNTKTVPVVLKTTDNKRFVLPTEYNVSIYGTVESLANTHRIYTVEIDIAEYMENSEIEVKLELPEGIKVDKGNEEITVKLISSYFN